MAWSDVLKAGLDQVKDVAREGMEKVQEKHEESQRVKSRPCVACGEPVGGIFSRYPLKDADHFLCGKCGKKLPPHMQEQSVLSQCTPEDARIAVAFGEQHPETFTVESTGFRTTAYMGCMAIDEERHLFVLENFEFFIRRTQPHKSTEVFRCAWVDHFKITMRETKVDARDARADVHGEISMEYSYTLPQLVPPGLSFRMECGPKTVKRTVVIDKDAFYDSKRKYFVSNTIQYREPEYVEKFRASFRDCCLEARQAE